jgi:hypothetical protein
MRVASSWLFVLVLAVGMLPLIACVQPEATPTETPRLTPTPTFAGPTRTFALGFTDFPHQLSIEALLEAYAVIERDGDLATLHFDDGVPWPEALAGEAYPKSYQDEVNGKASLVPSSHLVYLAITPISFGRDGLASYRGATANEPLPAPWDGYTFDQPDVVDAFAAHAERMIETYSPDFFAYAIEANMLYANRPDLWPAFLALAEATYDSVKASHPELPVFVTLQAELFHQEPAAQTAAIAQLLPFTDLIAVSTYPFIEELDVAEIPPRYFADLAELAPEKPFAVAETGWPAENVGLPYPATLPGSDEAQRTYVERLLREAEEMDMAFVTWFFTRDYDAQWEEFLSAHPAAATLRIWRDNGLYTGEGEPRSALASWREALAKPRS